MKNTDLLHWMHPLVKEWFTSKLKTPTEPQTLGWPAILANKPTLISAPTGSGKTLAAFLVCIDQLIRQALDESLASETAILYVSPLKALGNDIHKNLTLPLQEIRQLAKSKGFDLMDIRISVRTGDTLPAERQAMLKKPPHVLITTPESLYLLLTAEKSREILTTIQTVIIDEIHAMANNKRGAHLSLSLERLTQLSPDFVRIGLSATQKPIEKMAEFLVGNRNIDPVIINIGHIKNSDLAIEIPRTPLAAVASNDQWEEIYDQLATLINAHKTTLIFTNTRKMAERTAHHLAERLGKDQVLAHHGSLSRKSRLHAENLLKTGALKALVATASLELGIDIGHVDLVCQTGSPRSIAVMLQRAGRAGHWRGGLSKARIFATTRDELLEAAALVKSIEEKHLDALIIPKEPLDVLSQQIIAACATQDWDEEALFQLMKQSFFYKDLTRERWTSLLELLSQGINGARGKYSAFLYRDTIHGVIKARRGARLAALTNSGAIPENALYTVIAEPGKITVGTLDEDFAIESHRGDIILLGSTSWRINRIESFKSRVWVEDAFGAPPTIPFWLGEAPSRTEELSLQLSQLRQEIGEKLLQEEAKTVENWLVNHCKVSQFAAQQMMEYILQAKAVLGVLPTQDTIVAERFFDESGGMQLIIHAPFGARINKAWGLALRKCFCRSFNFELQAAATDNGINISLTEIHSFPLTDIFNYLHPESILKILTQAIIQSPMFGIRWRWVAGISLALLRFQHGKKVPPYINRIRAEDLLAAVFPDAVACQDNLGGKDIELPDHPLVQEALNNILYDTMDIEGFTQLLHKIHAKTVTCIAVDTPVPSVFSQEILNANPYAFLDDAPLEERRARAVNLRHILPDDVLKDIGKLDPAVVSEVQNQIWPDIRNADELHDALQSWIAFPCFFNAGQNWQIFMEELSNTGRAQVLTVHDTTWWFSTENRELFADIYENPEAENREDSITKLVKGWMFTISPASSRFLAELLQIEERDVNKALLKLEASGLILRGFYKNPDEQEWCERRILSRIHKLALSRLRKDIEAVKPEVYFYWLIKWQHVAPDTQLSGEQGLLEVIRQLQGFEMPAKAWEQEIFKKRVKNYDPLLLDRLCLTGKIGWGRFTPFHSESKRITPTSISPVTFFIREESLWLSPPIHTEKMHSIGHAAKDILMWLKEEGASFFPDIVEGIHRLKSEVSCGLWELVTAGLVSADSFDNLRALIDPKRRLKQKRHRYVQSINGRWSVLKTPKRSDDSLKMEAWCILLLKRYGILFRELLTREKLAPLWRELLPILRRMEDRGELRGGRFVSNFSGEQFAVPAALESLRASKNNNTSEPVYFSATDPLNLTGIILHDQRIPAISGTRISFHEGKIRTD